MSTQYRIYEQEVLKLTATLVIKSVATAVAKNERLSLLGYAVDESVPQTWKYYLNMAGQYHPSDTMMQVKSMDTLETIDFTVENLKLHRATWREYQYGTRYYKELVARYPDQIDLIKGVLNPVDIATAIAAKDHTILYYDSSLVETREQSFVPQLQDFIDAFFLRHYNPDYALIDSLYETSLLVMLYSLLPAEIRNIRLGACKSDYAHSFHIKRHLASFGKLDQYYDSMTESQRLFFYRNLRYINRNNGKIETFGLLTQKTLTDRNFSLARYTMQQVHDAAAPTLQPAIQHLRTPVNGISPALGKNVKTTAELLEIERPLARDNQTEETDALTYVPEAMQMNLASTAQTKVLESNILDRTDAEPYTLSSVLLNHWLWLADTGRYRSVLKVVLPDTGETLRISVRDAAVLYFYLYNRAVGFELPTVPELHASRVRRTPLPSFATLRAIAPEQYCSDAMIHEALRDNPAINQYVSVDAFRELALSLHQRLLLHRDLSAYRTVFHERAAVKTVCDHLYADTAIDLDRGQSYPDWLAARRLDFSAYTAGQLMDLATSIYTEATGEDLSVKNSLKDMHAAMLGIMSTLSSYSVQFIQQINTGKIEIVDWPTLQPGDLSLRSMHHLYLRNVYPTLIGTTMLTKGYAHRDLNETFLLSLTDTRHYAANVEIGVYPTFAGRTGTLAKGMHLQLNVGALAPEVVDLATLLVDVPLDGYTAIAAQSTQTLFTSTATNDFRTV